MRLRVLWGGAGTDGVWGGVRKAWNDAEGDWFEGKHSHLKV